MTLTAQMVKEQALELGADLVGIVAGGVLDAFPPDPDRPQTPSRVSREDSRSVVVVARRLLSGTSRLQGALNRQKLYAAELTLNELEDISLGLVYFIEDHGFPAVTLPPCHSDADELDTYLEGGAYGPLSLTHAAVEAGLGTLGLNLMLLTPEFGPRVLLAGVQTSAELEPDPPLAAPLCQGPECGRCLLACPGDAILQWGLDKKKCAPHASPFGFDYLRKHLERLLECEDPKERIQLTRGREMFEIWQSVLRGVGAYSGCTRCLEVCPVGDDYEKDLSDVQERIEESSEGKLSRLEVLRTREERGEPGPLYPHSERWIRGPASGDAALDKTTQGDTHDGS